MSATERVWRLLDTDAVKEAENDLMTFALQSEGSLYVVNICGPHGMSITHMTDAMRAALFYALKAGQASDEAIARLGVRIPDAGELTPPAKLS